MIRLFLSYKKNHENSYKKRIKTTKNTKKLPRYKEIMLPT